MAANKKPGNPWNQFPKKKAPGKLSNRTPQPNVTPSRAVGAGGPPAAPKRSGGGGTKRGGALVKAAGNGNPVSAQINPVKVRDVTRQSRGQVAGTTTSGSIKARKPTLKQPSSNLNPTANPPIPKAAAASTVENAVKGASKLRGLGRSLGLAGELSAIATTANSVFNPNSEGNQQLAKAMAAVNKRYSGKNGTRFKNQSGGTVQSKGEKTRAPMPKGSTDTLREKAYASLQKFQVPKTKATSSSSDSNQPTTRSGGSSGGGSNRPASKSSSSGPRLAASKPSAPGQSKDMNENYRVWAAANPTLADKVKKGQAGFNAFSKDAVAGTGPVRDSKEYKPSVASKPSEVSKPSTTDIAYNKETNFVDRKKKKGQP
jgi:hypothetical protein